MSLTVFTSAFLLDCTGAEPVEGAAVVVEDDRIREVVPGGRVGPLPGRVEPPAPAGRERGRGAAADRRAPQDERAVDA